MSAVMFDLPVTEVSIPHKALGFTQEVLIAAKDTVVKFFKDLYHHAETVTVLCLSSVGLSNLLSHIPFLVSMPAWVETPLVIPVVAVLIILGLLKLAGYRRAKRG